MKYLIKEYSLPIINLIAITIASFLLYLDYTSMLQHSATMQIGTITFKQKVAERRYSKQVIWEGLRNNSPVYNFDAIRTEKGSLAVINLSDGSSIELEEESMIIIQQSDQGLDIDFEKGAINAQKSDTENSLNIHSGDTVVALNDGGVNLNRDQSGSELNLNVSSGTAQLMTGGQTSQINSTQAVNVSAGAAEINDKQINLISPAAAKTLVSTEPVTVVFRWSSSKDNSQTLHISRDKNFKNLSFSITASEGTASAELAEGIYYWRVAQNESRSEVRRIAVVREVSPVILRPLNGQQFTFRQTPPDITFKWNGASTATRYTVEISRIKSMSSLYKSVNSHETFISVSGLEPGTYYCRIRAHYNLADGSRVITSPTSSFSLTKSPGLNKPKLFTPLNITQNTQKKQTLFNWQSVSEAKRYRITVKKSTQTLFTTLNSTNYFTYSQSLDPGKYSWNIIAIAADGTESPSSDTGTFKVSSVGKITTRTPSSSSRFKTGDSINFSWNDTNNSNKYLILISKDPLFTTSYKERQISSQFTTFSDLGAGSYYWKVFLLNEEGRRVVSSNSADFTVSGSVNKPTAISPVNTKYPFGTTSVSFQWRPVPDATHYEIEIYQDSFPKSRLIKRATTMSNSYTYNISSVEPGDFYWRVRSIQKSGSVILSTSDFTKEVFSKEPQKEPEKKKHEIEIISPSKIYIE
ncbi:MAG: FecR domain-containing protein [Spirochaetes bacterium]|jgi:hypothetical protein|nr:FecR domain-containing protein [Spirochaetota bacterium]